MNKKIIKIIFFTVGLVFFMSGIMISGKTPLGTLIGVIGGLIMGFSLSLEYIVMNLELWKKK